MGKINVLDFQVANLIAAGEVVDRPASAVKELLENAVDAGSENITVELKRGGISFIRVTDDGCGISEEDLPISIRRHATSKIRYASDLDGITTLGFRGEALAAIASVSKLRIMTRTKDEDMGSILASDGGKIVSLTRAGAQKGTTVIVEELFSNVPARRKFLKRDASEGMACAAVVEKIALSHPEISFKLISDGTLRYMTAGKGDLSETIYAVLGRDFSRKLIRVESLLEGINVYGFIGQPDNVRTNRNFQNFFINGRYVKSRTAASALEQAYESYIPGEKFPSCVLNIDIHPSFVDVNVHPTKLEVKFSDEKKIFDAIYCAAKNALEQSISRPDMRIEPSSVSLEDIKLKNAFTPIYDHSGEMLSRKPEQKGMFENLSIVAGPEVTTDLPGNYFDEPTEQNTAGNEPEVKETSVPVSKITEPSPVSNGRFERLEQKQFVSAEISPKMPPERTVSKKEVPYYKIIGEAFNSYVFVEINDKILMIDKHAAHERIIFEAMKSNMKKSDVSMQILLLPIEIRLDPVEFAAVLEFDKDIRSVGFDYTLKNDSYTINVTAIPSELNEASARNMVTVLAEQLSQGTGNSSVTAQAFMEKALYQASCKAAIKAGRIEDTSHIKWICDNLLVLPDIKVCPHGRPVAIELSRHEMEKQFKRI